MKLREIAEIYIRRDFADYDDFVKILIFFDESEDYDEFFERCEEELSIEILPEDIETFKSLYNDLIEWENQL